MPCMLSSPLPRVPTPTLSFLSLRLLDSDFNQPILDRYDITSAINVITIGGSMSALQGRRERQLALHGHLQAKSSNL